MANTTLNETDFLTKTSGPIRIVVPDAQAELDLETPEGVQAGKTLARIVPATENALSHHSSIAEKVSRLPRALGLNFIYNGHALGNGLLQRTGVEPVAAHLLRSIHVVGSIHEQGVNVSVSIGERTKSALQNMFGGGPGGQLSITQPNGWVLARYTLKYNTFFQGVADCCQRVWQWNV